MRPLSLIKGTGNVVLVTQNAWLNTEYGKHFQSFLLKNTFVRSIIDSDYKYFDNDGGPNINTVISIFTGRRPSEKGSIAFARIHEDLAYTNDSPFCTRETVDPERAEIHRYPYGHPLISDIKWGILLAAPDEFFYLLGVLRKRATVIGKIEGHQLAVGQGLNLSRDYIVDHETAKDLGIHRSAWIPIFTSEDGAQFVCTSPKNILVDRKKISVSDEKRLHNRSYSAFDPESTTKPRPILMLPRGVGRYFCAFNEANAYSASCVDIYDLDGTSNEDMRLNLWVSLNSSVCWLYRELSGRKNLGGGMLKAEAIDMKAMPVYMAFDENRGIKSLFGRMKQREALEAVAEVDSEEHQKIDQMVFEYLGLSTNDGERIRSILKAKIGDRTKKSKT